MVFSEYIESLPERSNPKTEVIHRIADACCVTVSTVYRWIGGSIQPDGLKRRTIAEILCRPESELFPGAS